MAARARARPAVVMEASEQSPVSIGVAELPQHGTSSKELLESADAALYRAKREGRDRVMVADTPVPAEVKLM